MSTLTQFLSGKLKSQEFLSSGTFTVPAGVTTVWVTMCGGGGSGSVNNYISSNIAGGGAGAYCVKQAVTVTPGASVTVTIGAGGAGVTDAAAYQTQTAGNDGSATSFGSLSVSGGTGGLTAGNDASNGVGGANGGGNGLPGQSAGGRPGKLSGGAGGLFGDGTNAARGTGNSSSAAANSGAGSGGAALTSGGGASSGAGGSGRCIVEWLS